VEKQIIGAGIILILLIVGFSGCNDIDLEEGAQLSIQYFTSEPQIIEKGEYTNLSWIVTSAQSVIIDNGIGNVSNVGTQIVIPEKTTTYILTAKNSSKILTASTTVIIVNKSTTEDIKIPDVNFSKNVELKTLTITDISDSILWSDIQVINGDKPSSSGYVYIGDIIDNCNDFVIITYQNTVLLGVWDFEDITGEDDNVIDIGDCADVHYTALFKSNGTVFDTTYESIAQKWGIINANMVYEPLKVFVNPNQNLSIPKGCENYSSSMIKGVINGLIGMKKGEKKLITIYPEDSYGIWNVTQAEEYGLSPYPIEATINYEFDFTKRPSFQQFFPDITPYVGNTFDWGAQMIDVSDVITATITKVNGTNVSIKLHPIINIVFTMPPFNWTVRIIDNTESSFILRTETYVGFETQIDIGYGALNMIVTDINNKDITLGINTQSPDIKFIDKVLVYEIEVINVYSTK
jgi:hypothetical protein